MSAANTLPEEATLERALRLGVNPYVKRRTCAAPRPQSPADWIRSGNPYLPPTGAAARRGPRPLVKRLAGLPGAGTIGKETPPLRLETPKE